MIDLNEMIIGQLKERDAAFPDVTKGVLVAMVIVPSDLPMLILHYILSFLFLIFCSTGIVAIF